MEQVLWVRGQGPEGGWGWDGAVVGGGWEGMGWAQGEAVFAQVVGRKSPIPKERLAPR